MSRTDINDDDGRESSSHLRKNGLTDGQIATLRSLGRDLSPERIDREVAWIRAGKRSSTKVLSEAGLLFALLRDDAAPPAEAVVHQERARRIELDDSELGRRRAEAEATQTPEARAAGFAAIARAKERLRKGITA